MLYNYLKMAFRNLRNNKLYSFLNITGLAVGIAVGLLSGLWVFDEISFDTGNRNYERIAVLQKNRNYNGTIHTENTHSIPLAAKLKESYGNLFEEVVLASYAGERIDNKIDLKVAGVYKDMPQNSAFMAAAFYSSFHAFAQPDAYVGEGQSDWNENSFAIYVKVAPNVHMDLASAAIKNAVYEVTS